MTLSFAVTLAVRYLLVVLFLPFSAIDKILGFSGAIAQAREAIPSDSAARLAIVAALCIEIIMPLGILTGVADRLAALIMAGYCAITALLWKQFWKPGDFWCAGSSRARDLFWDFLKNLSLAGGFLLITFGTDAAQVRALLSDPQLSSHPYSTHQVAHRGRAMQKPRIPYWHLWTDGEGISRQTRCLLTEFELQSISKPAQPQWQGHRTTAEVTVMMTVLPVGWTGEWHENPKPQWILPLSGRWFVESMDGQRVEMGPGELSFGGDQNAREAGGRKGHFSGVVGDEPAVLMLIQFETVSPEPSPCPFR